MSGAPGSGSAPPATSLELPPTLDAAALARDFLAQHAGGLDDELLYDAKLLVTELVANAVKHGQPAIILRVRLEPPGIGVWVHDDGDGLPEQPDEPVAPDHPSGRGLRIVSTLASDWGVETSPGQPGKTVWFQLRAADG